MAKGKHGKDGATIIKKYANRRLYDTGRSSYVTLDDLCEMVQEGHEFVVVDAKTNEDITRSVFTQIIADQEAQEGNNLLPMSFLKNLIGFYGDNMQILVPNYLESTLNLFVQNQERMREQINKSLEAMPGMKATMNGAKPMNGTKGNIGMFPPGALPPALEELNRQNIAMFERTMKMFTPFGMTPPSSDKTKEN